MAIVRIIDAAIQGQLTAQNVTNPMEAITSSTDTHPVNIKLPEELAATIRPGAQATVTVFTEEDNPINILAEVLQYIGTWMNYIF